MRSCAGFNVAMAWPAQGRPAGIVRGGGAWPVEVGGGASSTSASTPNPLEITDTYLSVSNHPFTGFVAVAIRRASASIWSMCISMSRRWLTARLECTWTSNACCS
jgi:hypothetical protein